MKATKTPYGSATDTSEAISEIARLSGADSRLLEEVFEQACTASHLARATLLLRMRWLLDREADEDIHKIDLLGRNPGMRAEKLIESILNPKETIFDFIVQASSVDRETLETIYETMLTSSTEPSGLPDLSEERTLQEMKWWIVDLDFPDYYFVTTPPEEIAHQILINRFHEVQGLDSDSYRNMKISYTSPSGTVIHWVHSQAKYMEVEQSIERDYYASAEPCDVSVYAHRDLYFYVVEKGASGGEGASGAEDAKGREGAKAGDDTSAREDDEFAASAPDSIFRNSNEERLDRYRAAWEEIHRTGSFYIEHSRKESTDEYRVMIGFPARVINHFMANLSRAMDRAGVSIARKYTVAFGGARPVIISSFYSREPFPDDLLPQIVNIGLYPDTRIARLTEAGVITPAETNFIHAMVGYVHTFIRVDDPNISYLEQRFPDHSGLRDLFVSVKRRMAKDTFTVDKITETFFEHPDVAKRLYRLFRLRHDPAERRSEEEFLAEVARFESDLESLASEHDSIDIIACAAQFLRNVIRTNFFLPVKTALVFRLDASFLAGTDFGRAPYAVFYVRGRDFTGFHVRFGDIARGGIRILTSRTFDAYRANADTLFEECYNLAATQDRKNKDIPEKGAKGIILPNFGRDDEAGREEAFRKYIDALLDLILPSNREHIAAYEEELLFFGPDEGSAGLMDWACERARDRGYRFWKAFTTGKGARLGGISHIRYGMTTNGVHRYVLGVLAKLGVAEESITKVQTGGPDGDLGGNEILLSKDKTIAVVDGGGVLFDPDGLERRELERLARQRVDCSRFDPARLGPKGFLVRVDDRDVTLPDGTKVQSGLTFRNGFHLSKWMRADLFVPCGGRPASISSTNWEHLLDEKGTPRIKWIVEGANLFITQEARIELERHGVVLFKDSTTNKGGVTSSSYEVLAGLALPDEVFNEEMCAEEEGTTAPALRRGYIEEIIELIKENADAEFSILWRSHEQRGTPLSELSDLLSARILEVTREIEESTLFEDDSLVANTLRLHFPRALVEKMGMKALRSHIPTPYLEAIFARTIARRFVYEYGLEPSYEEYRIFIDRLRSGVSAPARS